MTELERLRRSEAWIAWVRLGAVPFAVFQVAAANDYPATRYQVWAWANTALLAAGAAAVAIFVHRGVSLAGYKRLAAFALALDTAVVSLFTVIYAYESGTPIRQLLFLPVIEAAFRYGMRGALLLTVPVAPVLGFYEWLRADRFEHTHYKVNYVTLQLGLQVITGLIVGWLVERLREETRMTAARADEAEALRDELGKRVDLLEAANRCARALGSSLDLEEAFNAFIRELKGLVEFDRVAIILSEGGTMRVIAAAGLGVEEWLPPGSTLPPGSLIEHVLDTSQTVYREDMSDVQHPEEADLVAAGLRARVAAPLMLGGRVTGMLAVLRREPDSFVQEEIELITLLGRMVSTAVQNIRAYDAEHRTVEELRRLSALRADFVSLVSHELRSPMAAVIGSAQTLRQRWRELTPEQRESFLALISDETGRLADLVADVLDTSRIEAGTFSYAFHDVQVAALVDETVAAARIGQDEVDVRADVDAPLPAVRGDRERLRQVLTNLIDNAVKYSPAGEPVVVRAYAANGLVRVEVADHGPGVPPSDHGVIFEKFGRSNSGQAKPGTGLGLFIARSIAEAHGGTLTLRSAPERGAVFTLELPSG